MGNNHKRMYNLNSPLYIYIYKYTKCLRYAKQGDKLFFYFNYDLDLTKITPIISDIFFNMTSFSIKYFNQIY